MDVALAVESPQKQPKQLLRHAFTKENAVEMQRRAAAAQQLRLDRERAEAESTKLNPQTPAQRNVKDRADIVAEQIVRTRKELNKDLDPRARAQLLCALDRLLDRERILLAVPLPGSRRPGRESTSKRSGEVGPVE